MTEILGYLLAGAVGALLLAIGVIVALLRGRRTPEQTPDEHLGRNEARAEPPRRLPDPIATEDDYDSSSTLPPPGADSGAGDHDLARWLDERAASKAD